MGQHEQGQVLIEDRVEGGAGQAVDRVVREPADRETAFGSEPFDDVPVRRELAARHGNRTPAGSRVKRGNRQPVQVDGGRIRHDDFAGPRPEEARAEQVAHAQRQVQPRVPAADEVARPRRPGQGGQRRRRGCRRPPERVPVEVDDLRIRDLEPGPERGEGVGLVERGGIRGRRRVHVGSIGTRAATCPACRAHGAAAPGPPGATLAPAATRTT